MKTINSLRSKLLAFTLALMASVSSFAKDGYPDFQVDELYYNFLEGDSVQVTFLRPPTVPTEVAADASNKKNVSGAGYSHLTEIVIPSTVIYEDKTYQVTRIGHGAFFYCPNLIHIDLPISIKSIGIAAFRSCRVLASITLNEGLESIEHQAFFDCARLKEVTLPSTLKTMGQQIFAESNALEKVTCKAIVPPIVEKDMLTNTDKHNAAIIANATLYVPAQSLTTYQNTYPWNTFGQILPIEDSFKDLFPTLWGLERTDVEGTTMGYDDPYHMSFSKYTPTLVDGIWYLFDGRNYFREANNQILWYAPYLNIVDAVLYDWTLQVGDTLPIYSNPFHKDNNRGSLFRVTDVSTITLLDGKEYKKWTFSGGFEVVEGIGAINKGFGHYYCLLHTTHPAVYTGWKPICISKNGQLLYQMDELKMISNELKCMCELTPSYKDQWCNTWNTIDFDGMRFEETAETWQYKLANDTIINNQKYTIVNRYWTADRNNTKQYVAAVRFTDDRKVYIYYDNAEYLLYDFNVQEGDELEVFAGINNYTSEIKTYKCTVTGVEQYACVGCPAAITLEVHNHPNDFREFYRQTQWIEGVGDINGFLNGINHYVEVDGGYTYCLLCAYHDEEQVYTTDNEKLASYNCEYNAGYEYSSPTLAGLQRTMCREYIGYEGRNETWMTETEKEVLINDKFYRKWDKWLLREENDRIYVYSNKQDILLYDFTLEVGDSLRTLILHPDLGIIDVPIGTIYPIDTLIVTNISTVTLLDGKEYRKWSFNNGEFEYVKGIGCLDGNFLALAKDVVNGDYINSHLVCVSKNGKLLYQMDDAEMERLGTECLCEIETSYKSQWCDTWNVLNLGYWTNSWTTKEDFETWKYCLAHDTIIGNYTYTAVTRQTTKVPEGVYPFIAPAPEYVAAVRFTDDSKVYIHYDNTEYLLYDFNVQPGDELTVFAGINHYHSHKTNTCRIHEVERTPGLEYSTKISLMVIPDFTGDVRPTCAGETKWIEGVGDLCGFITGADCGLSDDQSALLCAYKEGNQEYSTELEEYAEYGCEYNSGENKEYILTLPGLQRTGCTKTIGENENGTVWGSRSYLMQEIETATIDGKQYLLFGIDNNYDKLYLKLWLREENNKILLYSTAQKKDLVLYDFTLNVGDSLPRLYVDYDLSSVVDYDNDEWGLSPLVVTEVSTITLLDGKEYKKWTFDNGMQYVEGIGSFGTCYAHNDFYQLIANAPLSSDVYSQYLVCASRNGKLLYQMDDTEMERLGAECLCEVEKKWSDTWCNQWNILFHGYLGPQDPLAGARTSIYWLSNNTVNRNGQEYIPLMCSSSLPNEESTHLVGELRFTEDKQVYFYYAFDETEYLLYDFGAELGDTLELFAGLEFYNYHKTYTHVITDKETLDDGRLQIQADVVIRIDNGAGEYFEEKHPVTWIEGLGSTYGIIFNPSNPGVAGDGAIIMLCAYRDDECVYTTNFSDYKNMGCVYNNDGTVDEDLFPMLTGLQRTICNEYCGDTEDDNSANNTYKQTFDSIFFENDKPYILCNDFLLREEDNKILIYSQLLNKDLVLYDFTLEVGDSLPALYIYYHPRNAMDWIPYNLDVVDYNKDFEDGTIYPADTFVVTDISNVTLLDGKEYKKWTFDNGMEYVEGIGMYGGRRGGNFFGLIQEVVVPCHTGTHLVCVSKNGQLLYQMDDAEMERLGAECLCDYNSGPKRDNAKDGQIGGRPTPTQWNQLEVVLRQMDNNHTILQAETFSYTLEDISQQVNNKTYFQLARQSTKDTATTKSVVGALHFGKDEDNRVYFLRDGVEYVLYDFTVEPGDTIEIFAGINNYPQETTYTHVVTSKDTLENGACRMMLEVVFPEETSTAENVEKVWLAGLGSVDGIVHNAAKRTSNAHAAPSRSASSSETESSVMLCAWREDSCLYTTDHPDYDTFGCVYNQDPTAVEDISTSQSSYQKLLRDGQLLIIHNDKIYNVLGLDIGKSSVKIVESLTNN